MRTKRYPVLLTWLVAGLSWPVLAQKKVGPEFQVNTYGAFAQGQNTPKVASDAAGNFVVVWNGSYGISGQRYDNKGNPLGGEFQVNTYTTGSPSYPSVAVDATGNFVVVWTSFRDGDSVGIFAQRYDSDGEPRGDEFQVNTYTTGQQRYPSVASDIGGNFVVIWSSYVTLTRDVRGQRYDADGNPLGGEFGVNLSPQDPRSAQDTSVASAANGNFVVVWDAGYPDVRQREIFGQRYDNNGNALGEQFHVNTYTPWGQSHPSVASDASGNFVVVWEETGGREDVFGQRFDADGNPRDGEFRVNSNTQNLQASPSVSSDASGNFVVVWRSYDRGPADDIFGQRYDIHGNPAGEEFPVNTWTTNHQRWASVASAANGNFVVVWFSYEGHARGNGTDSPLRDGVVFGQRFAVGCEASLQVQGDVHAPGGMVPVQVHIAHHRPKTVTVPWELRLTNANGQRIVRRVTEAHTFQPGDVVDRDVDFQLPDDLAAGTYTLELAISGMAGTQGATTTLRVVRAE